MMPLHYYFHQQQTIHRKQLETCVGIVSNVVIIKLSKIMWLTQKRRPPMAPRVLKLTKTHNLLGLKSSKRWSINDRNTYLMKHFETNSQRFNYTYIYNIYIYCLICLPTGCIMWYPCVWFVNSPFSSYLWGWFAQDCWNWQPPAARNPVMFRC